MPKAKTDEQGRLVLPESFLRQRPIAKDTEFWLDEHNGDLVLHPCLPNIRTLIEWCWGWNPSCADCLWAQDIIRCP